MIGAKQTFVLTVILILVLTLLGPPPVAQASPAAPITVTTGDDEFVDPGPGAGCSLREAIQAANGDTAFGGCPAGSGDDVIELPAGPYILALNGAKEDLNATGDLDISSNITINGTAQATTTIDANQLDRVLDIHSGTVILNDLTITRGFAPNGAAGPNGAGFSASGADGLNGAPGGGIRNAGTLTLNRCTINDNRAGSGGNGGNGQNGEPGSVAGQAGGLGGHGGDGGEGGNGGGINSTGSLTLNGCTVDANWAGDGGAGGHGGDGGDGAAGDAGTKPGANGGSGGRGGQGGKGGRGGGIDANGAPLDLDDTLITGNQSGDGGHGGLSGEGGDGGAGFDGGKGGMGLLGGVGGIGGPGGEAGGLWGFGPINVSGCTLSQNQAGDGGHGQHGALGGLGGAGGSSNPTGGEGGRGGDGGAGGQAGAGGNGGAIRVWSTLTMTLSTVELNTAGLGGEGGDGGPGGNGGAGGNATFPGNGYLGGLGGAGAPGASGGDGGGVFGSLNETEELSISQCTFQENDAGDAGAGGNGGNGGDGGAPGTGINLGQTGGNGHGRDGGLGGRGGEGGGLWVQVGDLAIVRASTFYLNTAGDGGRGGNGGDSGTNPDSTMGNAGDGAIGASGGFGAAILVEDYALPQPLLLENCTLHDNNTGAGGDGGDGGSGLANDGAAGDGGDGGNGGGVANREQARLVSLTVTDNAASITFGKGGTGTPDGTDGGYGHGGGVWTTGSLSLGHTIISYNFGGSGRNCWGTIDSLDYNLIEDKGSSCTLTGSTDHIYQSNARLRPLGDYGGPTQSQSLMPTSAALDNGDSVCSDASGGLQTVDQRGYTRPHDGRGDNVTACDIGALEMQGYHLLTVAVDGDGEGRIRGSLWGIGCTKAGGECQETYEAGTALTLTAQAQTGWSFLGWDGDCSGADLDCPLTMDTAKLVTGTFGLVEPDKLRVFLPLVLKDY